MVKLKDSSVNITNLHPNLVQFLNDMSDKFDGIVVSSGNDSIHLPNSRHFLNKAIDIGANSSEPNAYAAFKDYVLSGAKSSHLPEKFAYYGIEDILDEYNHIHIELPLTVAEIEHQKNVNYVLIVLAFGLISLGIIYICNIPHQMNEEISSGNPPF